MRALTAEQDLERQLRTGAPRERFYVMGELRDELRRRCESQISRGRSYPRWTRAFSRCEAENEAANTCSFARSQ